MARLSASRSSWIGLVGALLGTAAIMGAAWVFANAVDREIGFLTREPQTALEGAWYAGAVSQFNASLYVVAITACALAWLAEPPASTERQPLLAAALLLTIVWSDDFFLLHDVADEKAGSAERFFFATYLILVVAYAVAFRDFIRRRDGTLLLAAGVALLALSAAVDVLWDGHYFFEDGAKLAGVGMIVFFFTRAAFETLREGRPA